MTEVVRIKRLIRKFHLIKRVLLNHIDDDGIGDAVQGYYTLREYVFKDFNIDKIELLEEEDGVFVHMTNGEKYYFDYDELYTPSTWAAYDEEDEPLDEEF